MGRERQARLTVSILIEHQGKLMMIQEAKEKHRGRWNHPGGHIEKESPREAAVREAKEESGLDIILLQEFATYYDPSGEFYFMNFCFRARPVSLVQSPLDSDIMQAKWHSPQELLRMPEESFRSPLVKLRINHWVECRGSLSMGYVLIPPKPKR